MSEWITDRRPTVEDADYEGRVWITRGSHVVYCTASYVEEGEPWQPTRRPEPYVKPKRYIITADIDCYIIYDGTKSSEWGTAVANSIPTREAAERIAAIYEEVAT